MRGARIVLVVALCLALGPGVSDSTATQLPVAVHGHITNAATGQPVEHASVFVAASEVGARSNAEGSFLIRGVHDVPPIQVTVQHPCFHTTRVELEKSYYAPLNVGLPFRQPRDESGNPLPDACSAYRPN